MRARQEKTKATFICQTNGRLLSKPEAGLVSKRLLNSIARCHVCDAALVYWNKGGKRVAKFYCSARQYKGAAGCSNNVGIPAEALDEAVKLYHLLNEDFDTVVDLCMEQAAVWRAQRAASVSDRKATEREVVRLEGVIANLTDAIENGQPVGTRLKERQQQLDALRWKMEELEPVPDRKEFEDMAASLGPLVGLGMEDPATVRQVLRKIGVSRLVVSPDGDGWMFKGQGDCTGLLPGHKRVQAAPPDCPPPTRRMSPGTWRRQKPALEHPRFTDLWRSSISQPSPRRVFSGRRIAPGSRARAR